MPDQPENGDLQAERERLIAILEATSDFVGTALPDGRVLSVNRAGMEMSGRAPDEDLSNLRIEDFHPPWALKILDEEGIPAAVRDGIWKGESALLYRDGREISVSQLVMSHKDDEGNLTFLSTIVRDISDLKTAEAEIAMFQRLLVAAIEQSSAGILIADAPDVRIRYANSAALGTRGKSPMPLTDISLEQLSENWQVFHPDGTPFPPEELPLSQAVLHGRISRNVNAIVRRADGEDRWILANASPVRNAEGEIVAGVAVFPDITEMKKTQQALRERDEKLSAIFRVAPVGIGLVSERIFLESNDTLHGMLGYTRDEFRDLPARKVYSTREEYDYVGAEILRQIAERGTATLESRWVRKDGRILNLLLNATPLDPEDASKGYTFTAMDVTERKRAEEERSRLEAQLRQAQKMEAVGQLAGGVAHDFNNILTAILGNLELTLEGLGPHHGEDDPLVRGLKQAERSAQRASTLTRQLLAFSRRQVSKPTVLDLNKTLSEMNRMLRRLLKEDIELSTGFEENLHRVLADAGQIEQVVMNLVVNARDAMPDGGSLAVETANAVLDEAFCASNPDVEPGQYVALAVRDSGCGMDDRTVDRIFEPFFTTKEVGQGTGLGLSMVYGIIKQAGGHITVTSQPGMGSTFTIYLPAVFEEATESTAERSTEEKFSGTETILVCEDDDAVRNLAVRILEGVGYRVLAAGNSADAVDLARDRAEPIHLLVTDVIMPDMDGRKLAEILSDISSGLRTLFMSGYTSNVIAHHGVLDDGVDFLEKPFTRQELLQRVRSVLDSAPP